MKSEWVKSESVRANAGEANGEWRRPDSKHERPKIRPVAAYYGVWLRLGRNGRLRIREQGSHAVSALPPFRPCFYSALSACRGSGSKGPSSWERSSGKRRRRTSFIPIMTNASHARTARTQHPSVPPYLATLLFPRALRAPSLRNAAMGHSPMDMEQFRHSTRAGCRKPRFPCH